MAASRSPRLFHNNPEALIALSFLAAIATGAILLRLPVAAAGGHTLSAVDALFMATSAICVTGLSVVDIGSRLTMFGQLVVLALVQIGGLGIMTFSLLFLMLLGRRISLCSRYCMDTMADELDLDTFRFALAKIFTLTAAVELTGAALLFVYVRRLHPLPQAGFSAVFHAIAAFCNAGFSLYPDNLASFQRHPYVQLVVVVLIIIGGIGFIVIDEVVSLLKRRPHAGLNRLSLHTKVALAGTAVLIVLGTVGVWGMEQHNQLSGLGPVDRLTNAAFLSVASRTAGFNTLNTGMLANSTLCLVIVLMFIGACSGSTAGGIKVGTFAVLLGALAARLRGEPSASLFHRRFSEDTVTRAMTVFITAMILLSVTVFALQITEGGSAAPGRERGQYLELLFEAVSAFGTVGLSTGVTPGLSTAGKLLIVMLMFVGRVGPLTMVVALQMRKARTPPFAYPQEEILIG